MIRTDIKVKIKYTAEDINRAITERLPIESCEINDTVILRRSLNLGDTSAPHYDICVGVCLSPEREAGLLKMKKKVFSAPNLSLLLPSARLKQRPVVVGAGPAGLFAALTLAEAGARPILIERGEAVENRRRSVSRFFETAELNEESNIQFGEGGAGAFSDGKLKYGALNKYKYKVLTELISAGAPEDIAYSTSAHLGTDRLPDIVRCVREKIKALGGEVIFSARLVDIGVKEGKITSAVYEKGGERVTLDTDNLILAIGHSARDTVAMLTERGLFAEPRGFGIGVRIEHPREYIDDLIYKEAKGELGVGASYHLVTHLCSGRSVYSFCMCPGGSVVAAASERSGIVTNGMSEYARDGENSNAALLVSVTPRDFPDSSVLGGFELQRRIERAAYSLCGGFAAPAQRLGDFMRGEASQSLVTRPTYPIGTLPGSHDDYMPSFITDSLRAAMSDFDSWLGGYYYPDATLTGAETRSTSPVRFTRGESLEALGFAGLYPIGEGAGYSGGIVSSAADGVLCAEAVLLKHSAL